MIASKPKRQFPQSPQLARNLFFRDPNHSAYRPRRKPVTIGIGFVHDEGILLCADTKVSGAIKEHQSKLAQFVSNNGYFRIVFAMSGEDLNFPKAAVDQCWEFIREMDFATVPMETVHYAVNESLSKFHRKHIYKHPDRVPGSPYLQFLVGMWLRDRTSLYLSHETVLNPIDQFDCIGSGAYLAKFLVQQYMAANENPTNLLDVSLIAKLAATITSTYDQFCEGPVEMLTLRNDGTVEGPRTIGNDTDCKFAEGMAALSWKLLHNLAHDSRGVKTDSHIDTLAKELKDLHLTAWWNF